MSQEFIATGRRKNAVARIRMSPGTGKIEVNGRPFDEYFKTTNLQNTILQPFEVVKSVNQFDVSVNATDTSSLALEVWSGSACTMKTNRDKNTSCVQVFSGKAETQEAALYQQIGRLQMEVEWLKKKYGLAD